MARTMEADIGTEDWGRGGGDMDVLLPPPDSVPPLLEPVPPQHLTVGPLRLSFVRALGSGGEGTAWLYRTDAGPTTYVVVKSVRGDRESRHAIAEQQLHAFEHSQRCCGDVRGQIGRLDVLALEQGELELCDEHRLIVLPYVDGVALDAVLDKAGCLPSHAAGRLCAQVASRAADLHAAGVVHRDIKPANIVLIVPRAGRPLPEKQVEMIDLGMASVDGELPPELARGDTPAYLSPEQWDQMLTGEPVGASTDVYAVGHVAYLAKTGKHLLEDSLLEINALRAAHNDCVDGRYRDSLRALRDPMRAILKEVFVPARDRPTMRAVAKLFAAACRAEGGDPASPLMRRRAHVPAPIQISAVEATRLLVPEFAFEQDKTQSAAVDTPTRPDPEREL